MTHMSEALYHTKWMRERRQDPTFRRKDNRKWKERNREAINYRERCKSAGITISVNEAKNILANNPPPPKEKLYKGLVRGSKEYDQMKYSRSKELWYYQTIRVDQRYGKKLKELAKSKNISVPELIRTYIVRGVKAENLSS